MHRISSTLTWWHKKAFPTVWFGGLGLVALFLVYGVFYLDAPAAIALAPFGLAAYGYALMRWLVFPLADEVWIEGDEIIVENRGQEDRIPIANIIDADESILMNPKRVTLTLREPCRFGQKIIFTPPLWWGRQPFDELMSRVRAARHDGDANAHR